MLKIFNLSFDMDEPEDMPDIINKFLSVYSLVTLRHLLKV